jgi:hypothetical protein
MFDDLRPRKYWSDMAKRLCASGSQLLDEMVYWCATSEINESRWWQPDPYAEAFRTVPDFAKMLSWDQIQPIDKLVLWVKSPSAILQRIPAKETIINLQEGALFRPHWEHNLEKIPDLAVVRSILETRAVTSTSIFIVVLPPAHSAVVNYIRAVHPDLVEGVRPTDHPTWSDDYSSLNSEYNALTSLFMWKRTDAENRDLPFLAGKRYLESIKANLRKHHANTDVEKEDFEQIQFTFRPFEEGEWTAVSYEPMFAC